MPNNDARSVTSGRERAEPEADAGTSRKFVEPDNVGNGAGTSFGPHPQIHWVVRMNYRNRTGGFAALFALIGLRLMEINAAALLWIALVVYFLIYPQLAYWRAKSSSKSLKSEVQHMQFDALCYGSWIALLQFPLWIGFTLAISGVLNLILFRGVRGLFEALGLQALGMAVGGFMGGWAIAPQSGSLVTAFAIACISLYLVAISLDSQRRSMQLYATKQQLRGNEHALQQQLLEIQSLQAELRDQAHRDALTGLFNRHQLSEIVVHELARCAREGRSLCLLMMDIDHFKRVNDTYGHPVGDLVLQAIARLLQSRTRGSDWLFRYGGEEFLLLMPNTDVHAARSLADDVRVRYANTLIDAGTVEIQATLSFGVAVYPDHGTSSADLIKTADEALYRAKNAGRNRVEIA